MFPVARETFEALVREAVEGLPPELREQMNNVAIVVKERPSRRELGSVRGPGGRRPHELFGLYQGVPLTRRGPQYGNVLPDLITLYQETHEEACDTLEELREQVRITVRHEIAHHFGIDDARLGELGAY